MNTERERHVAGKENQRKKREMFQCNKSVNGKVGFVYRGALRSPENSGILLKYV